MAKNSVDDWSVTSSLNTDVGGTNIGEHCALSGINNAIRKVMAQTKQKFDSVDANNSEVIADISDIKNQVAKNAEDIALNAASIAQNADALGPATSEKRGTVTIVEEINENNDEQGETSSAVVTPSAVVDYVIKSADYGLLSDVLPPNNPTVDYAVADITTLTA